MDMLYFLNVKDNSKRIWPYFIVWSQHFGECILQGGREHCVDHLRDYITYFRVNARRPTFASHCDYKSDIGTDSYMILNNCPVLIEVVLEEDLYSGQPAHHILFGLASGQVPSQPTAPQGKQHSVLNSAALMCCDQ